MKSSTRLGLLLLCMTASACTLIPANPGANQVVVSEEAKVTACESKGSTSVSVIAKVGVLERLPDVVADELARLAANSAVDLAGDTVVPLGPVADGKRKFGIYKCRRDAAGSTDQAPAATAAPAAK